MATDIILKENGRGIANEIWKKFQEFQSNDSRSNECSKKRDAIIKEQLNKIRNEKKKKRESEGQEVEQLLTQKLPFEMLAKEWFDQQHLSLENRSYLLEKLIPTLVMGVEKLLLEAEKKDLVAKNIVDNTFNPINFLAQFLMRNNPRYSNFGAVSIYAKTIRRMMENLKVEAYKVSETNLLAQMKKKVQIRREEFAEEQRKMFMLNKHRPKALQDMFVDWAGVRHSVISLSLVQSALRSFQDYAVSLPVESQRESMFAITIPETDQTGKLINIREFVDYLHRQLINLSEESFNEFITHMSYLAVEYRASIELEGLRTIISNLFILCDAGETGLVDRRRLLKLLNMFYDGIEDPEIKNSLRNPRKFPVVEFEEEEDEVQKYISEHKLDDERFTTEEDETESSDNEETTFNDDNTGISAKPESPTESNRLENITEEDAEEKKDQTISEEKRRMDEKESDMEKFMSGEGDKELIGIDEKGVPLFACNNKDAEIEADVKALMQSGSKDSVDSIPGVNRPYSTATAHSFNFVSLNQNQFVNLLMTFLGDSPVRNTVEELVRFVRTGYVETEEERERRLEQNRRDAETIQRSSQTEQLFDIWDVDGSGYLEINEVEMVLSKWREENVHDYLLKEACDVFEDVFTKITRKSFKKLIDKICAAFPDEDVFDSLIQFLTRSVQRSFEERKRGDYRKKWLQSMDFSARTSGGLLGPLFETTFNVITLDAHKHGKDKKVSAYVAMLETNKSKLSSVKGERVLRYVACTPTDTDLVLNKILHRGMKCISFVAIDSQKPLHVPRVLNHGSVFLWNPMRREDKIEGSYVCLPLKNYERTVTGVLGIDTLTDPHDKSTFINHEISFYQGVAKTLSNSMQYIEIRQNTIKIAESAVSWILRRSPNVQDVAIYLIEPGLKPEQGTVLRKMALIGHNNLYDKPAFPPRLERKDNLFRDYLFKCIDTSETLTADAYGERHLAFPLRDAEGLVISIVDISIGKLKHLPPHELSEIHRMLKLLEMAHKEISIEHANAGDDKQMVLEVEKEHQTHRIDVLFDRIMLQDLRANVGRLDARAFAEIKSYKEPPKIIHDILNAVLGLYFNGTEDEETTQKLSEWTSAKQLINVDLIKWIVRFDPTLGDMEKGGEKLSQYLADILPGAVAKQGSLPAQFLFNWAFVCLSLIEHSGKMKAMRDKVSEDIEQAQVEASSRRESRANGHKRRVSIWQKES